MYLYFSQMRKQFAKDYLSFSRKERVGIYILMTLILLVSILPWIYPLFIDEQKHDPSEFMRQISMLEAKAVDSNESKSFSSDYNRKKYEKKSFKERTAENFPFDPNTATLEEWIRLGVREKTALSIQKYISKGGRFRKADDIAKIWGLKPEDVSRLIPLVRIAERGYEKKFDVPAKREFKEKFAPVSINTTDTNALIALPGIGGKLAKRIITFRDRLGGFVSVDQVGETFGLPDSTFQKIRKYLVADVEVKQLNINNSTIDELKLHPYIRYHLANAIVQYRNQHGDYGEVEDVRRIVILSDSMFKKMRPYLRVR